MKWTRGNYVVTDDKKDIDLVAVHDMLSRTYWADDRPKESIKASIEGSLCFALLEDGRQIGFARVLSDFAVHAVLLDVVVKEDARGQGLGKWMVQCIIDHPAISNLKKLLWTRDGDEFYRQLGFKELKDFKLMAKA